jgi:hypothetical protein
MFITLDANMEQAKADRDMFAAFKGKLISGESAETRKEIAAGDGDFTRVSLSEGKFIDLAIHKDTFLDDAALRSDITSTTPVAWKTRYAPVMGLTTGSVYGGAPAHLYQTQDNSEFLTPFVVDLEETKVPKMALTQDPEKLGQRVAALERQAEAGRLKMETFLVNFMTEQPLGTDLATSVYNYATQTTNPYSNKTVYVVDPGVRSGTYETTNIVDASAQQGLTPEFFDALISQEMLSGRTVRTLHIPKAGLPWRKLIKYATIVANASDFSAGQASNSNLSAVPAEEWLKYWRMDMGQALEGGLIISIFGRTFKIKANNALPYGCTIATTDQPAAEIFNITDRSFSYDVQDPREPFFEGHGEKRMMAVAVPDPWRRNWFLIKHDTPSL